MRRCRVQAAYDERRRRRCISTGTVSGIEVLIHLRVYGTIVLRPIHCVRAPGRFFDSESTRKGCAGVWVSRVETIIRQCAPAIMGHQVVGSGVWRMS